MATLYIRDVDDAVNETLKERAEVAGMSLSAFVGRELAKIAGRPSNAQIVERLRHRDRSRGPSTDDILEAISASRR